MRSVGHWVICLLFWWSTDAHAATPATSVAPLYDADPKHLWNRLNDALFVRTAPGGERYGSTELDILYWETTRHLLTSPSREKAIRVLDEFIDRHGERQVRDPLKRALLQRDLWELFDWSAYDRSGAEADSSAARAELQRRLVTIIKRVALSAEEIGRLPDNYSDGERHFEGAWFPRGLFARDGAWQLVGRLDGPTAAEHTAGFGGRSVFLVFVKFPGGREPALNYLEELREFVPALIYSNEMPAGARIRGRGLRTNPSTPQFPVGTQWALVRRLCLIDARGDIRVSPLIESIQTRSFTAVPDEGSPLDALRNAQAFAEFQLDRMRAPALRAVESGERDFQFVHFRSMGVDPFERLDADSWARDRDRIRGETLRTCNQCHLARGILSVNTYATFGTSANPLDGSTAEREASATLTWKSRQFDWGLLEGLWRTAR